MDDIDVALVILSLLQASPSITDEEYPELGQIWLDHREEMLKDVSDEKSGLDNVTRVTNLWKSLDYLPTAKPAEFVWCIVWKIADPRVAFEVMTQVAVSRDGMGNRLQHCQLQDFAMQYLHECLNCSPWMGDWRLVVQKLFKDATWEDLVALHIDRLVKEIWQWQFPLGAFGKWLDRALGMLKEDLTQAGIVLGEVASFTNCKQSQSGLGTTWMSTDNCSALWDPVVEELAGEFWLMIETPWLAVPGSWVFDDEHDSDTSACLFWPADEDFLCHHRRRLFYRGNECIGNKLLRVRGMMTCREMCPSIFFDGTEI